MNLLLVLFLAADGLLIAAAVHHTRSAPASGQYAGIQALTAGLSADGSSSAGGVDTASGATAAAGLGAGIGAGLGTAADAVPILLSASSATDGWRTRPGCHRAPHLQATSDAGKTWRPLTSPAAHILRIDMTGPTSGWLVGADASCAPEFFSTTDGGATWTAGSGLGQAWVVIGHRVRTPSGQISNPCGAAGAGGRAQLVTAASVTAALLMCGSGVLETTDGGATWAPVAVYPSGGQAVAAALVPGSAGRGVALLSGATGCAGLSVVRTADTGKSWRAGPCLSALHAPAAVSLAADGSGYALGGGASEYTTDAGATWS